MGSERSKKLSCMVEHCKMDKISNTVVCLGGKGGGASLNIKQLIVEHCEYTKL